jgi:hypothetical protein
LVIASGAARKIASTTRAANTPPTTIATAVGSARRNSSGTAGACPTTVPAVFVVTVEPVDVTLEV